MTKIEKARREAEKELGFMVPDEFAIDVLDLCKRKCECAGKNDEYLPIMYRFELILKVNACALNEMSRRSKSNRKEEENYVRNMYPYAMSPSLS